MFPAIHSLHTLPSLFSFPTSSSSLSSHNAEQTWRLRLGLLSRNGIDEKVGRQRAETLMGSDFVAGTFI